MGYYFRVSYGVMSSEPTACTNVVGTLSGLRVVETLEVSPWLLFLREWAADTSTAHG